MGQSLEHVEAFSVEVFNQKWEGWFLSQKFETNVDAMRLCLTLIRKTTQQVEGGFIVNFERIQNINPFRA